MWAVMRMVNRYDDPWPNSLPQPGLADEVWEEVCHRFGLARQSAVTVTEPLIAFILSVHRDILSRNREDDLPGLEDIELGTEFLDQLVRQLQNVFACGDQLPGRELTARILEAQETLVVEQMMAITAERPADTPWEWFNKGNALHRLGRLEEALDCYNQAVVMMKIPDAMPLIARSRVLEQLHLDQRALDDCRQAFHIAVDADRCTAEPLIQRAYLLLKTGDFPTALREAGQAVSVILHILDQRRTNKFSFIVGDEEVPIPLIIYLINELISLARIFSGLLSLSQPTAFSSDIQRLNELKESILTARNKLCL